MENDRITKRVYVGECKGSWLVGCLWKRSIDSVNDCLKKRGLNVGQARRMVYDMNEWREVVRGDTWGYSLGDEPLALKRCYSCGLSLLYEILRGGG